MSGDTPENRTISQHMAYADSGWRWKRGPFRGNRDLVIKGCHELPLVTRHYFMAFRPKWRGKTQNFGAILRHIWHRSDMDRELHDHPFAFVSVIVRGSYWEEMPWPKEGSWLEGWRMFQGYERVWSEANGDTYMVLRKAWRPMFRRARFKHAVRFAEGYEDDSCVSLVLAGPHVREWGFWTQGGAIWRQWKEFGKTRICP